MASSNVIVRIIRKRSRLLSYFALCFQCLHNFWVIVVFSCVITSIILQVLIRLIKVIFILLLVIIIIVISLLVVIVIIIIVLILFLLLHRYFSGRIRFGIDIIILLLRDLKLSFIGWVNCCPFQKFGL